MSGRTVSRLYEAPWRIVDLAIALQSPGRGMSLDDIEQRYGVCRKTALRMRDTVRRIFPELRYEQGPDGRRYWKLRRGRANDLVSWTVDEIAALEAAIHWAREAGLAHRERALCSVADKVKALIQPIHSDTAPEAAIESCPGKQLAGTPGSLTG
jgi:predicted DNA-binding transcriptional regulator YafY